MAEQEKELSRRAFIKTAGATAALTGFLFGAEAGAATKPAELSPRQRWCELSRPESPVRLSPRTHELARISLAGEHGRAMKNAEFALDESRVGQLTGDLRYAHATMLCAQKAPLRILPGEKIVGAATLLEAARHVTPVAGVTSTSHTTIGFHRVLEVGYKGLRQEISERLARGHFEDAAPDYLERLADGPTPGAKAYLGAGALRWAEAAHRPEYETPPLTVECRACIRDKSQFQVLVLNRTKDSAKHWELYAYHQTGCLSAYMPGYAPAEIVSGRDIADGQWHDLAMTFDGKTVCLFVDGEQVKQAAVTPSGSLAEGSRVFAIGGYAGQIPCSALIGGVRVSGGIRLIVKGDGAPLQADEQTVGLWNFAPLEHGRLLADESPNKNHLISQPPCRSRGKDLLEAMLLCLDAAQVWHERHMDELTRLADAATGAEREHYLWVRENLRHVPENPPTSFTQAVQSLWFAYAFQRLMGNWSGIGRIDQMLGGYLRRDLATRRITLDEARELIAHFWIKGTEWVGANPWLGSGDAQHYQNIILAGIDADGREVCNEVTHLVLDVVEELHISDFPIAVRLNRHTPKPLLRRVAEVQRHGGGIVALYNEAVVIEGLVKFGYEEREARTFTNDGCWEVLIPGATVFSYVPFDGLALLHEVLGLKEKDKPAPQFAGFEDVYAAYRQRLGAHIDSIHKAADGAWLQGTPAPLLSLLVDGCIERGRGYYDRGPRHALLAPHIGGMANIANGLLAIRKLVYEEKFLTLGELIEILRQNWEGQEPLRRLVQRRIGAFGNDDEEADAMMQRVFNDYTGLVAQVKERNGVKRPAGISTFGREIGWRGPAGGRAASPDGHRAEEMLATNFSPSPGTDLAGPTAVLKSYCKMDFTRTPNCATVELKVHPASVQGDKGVDALVALMRGFQKMGGMFLHIDVVDTALLLDAQRHPEKYPNLSVRIAGWSARFATLHKEWQDMVIQRTQQIV